MTPLNLIPYLLDRLRNLPDRTPRRGSLPPSDDLAAPFAGELPIETLRRELDALGVELLDWRTKERAGRGEARGTRKIEQCTAVLWHQTASILDLSQALGVPVHAMIFPRHVVLLHPIRAYLYHAGAGNRYTIGVEIVCRAAGIEGDARTFWRSRSEIERGARYEDLVHEADDRQLAAGRLLGAYYVAETARQGGHIVSSCYHRNTDSSRVSDPGSRIAWGIGLRVAEAHGLEHGTPVVGSGKATPTCWGGALGVPYNWRVRGY